MIKTYIVTWKNVSDRIDSLISQIDNHVVINSDAEPRDSWVNLGMVWYYNQFKYAVNDFVSGSDEIFCWITGDISYHQFNKVYEKAYSVMSREKDIAIYAPNFTHEAWGMDSCKIRNRDSFTYYACQTDGVMLFMKRDFVEILSEYMNFLSTKSDLNSMKSGWGLDYVWSTLAIYMEKDIVRDTEFIVTHPQGSSYDHGAATTEMEIVRETFFDYAHSKKMNMADIQLIWNKISGRMAHDPNCMKYENFYRNNRHNIEYTIVSINDKRIENKNQIKTIIGSEAIDIKFLNATDENELQEFLNNNKFKPIHNFKTGEVGCFGSHYLAWKYLEQSELESLIVIEDDAWLEEDFAEKIKLFNLYLPEEYDVFSIYVDKNQYDRYNNNEYVNEIISKGYQDWSTLCYQISKSGAKKLINKLENDGMDMPVDWFIFRNGHAGLFKVYTLSPNHKPPLKILDTTGSLVQHTNFLDGTENK